MERQHQVRRLHRRSAVSLHLPAGAALLVARGIGWLTSDQVSGDRLLCAGRTYTTIAREHLVLQAMGGTVVYAVRHADALPAVRLLPRLAQAKAWTPALRPAYLAG